MRPRFPGEPLLPTRRPEQAVLIALGAMAAILAALVLIRRSLGEKAPFQPSAPGPVVHYRIDINTADATELQLLPGVGASLAARIVRSRELDGPFLSVDALARVSGIGPDLIDRLRPLVRTEPEPDPFGLLK